MSQFWMAVRCPRRIFTVQKVEQFPSLHLLAGSLEQESGAAARPNQGIDFLQQVAGDQDVRSLCACHMCISSVPYKR
jgi:hypothetical protein